MGDDTTPPERGITGTSARAKLVGMAVLGLVAGALLGALASSGGGDTTTVTQARAVDRVRTETVTKTVPVTRVKTVRATRTVEHVKWRVRTRTVTVAAPAPAADPTPASSGGSSGGGSSSGDGGQYAGMNCSQIGHSFNVTPGSDPEHDADNDGVACESYG
jgi:hypothetical protein